MPPLDDSFVAAASFREPSLRDRQLGSDPVEETSQQKWRNWAPPPTPYRRPTRKRQVIGVIITVVVVVVAYVPTRFLGGHGQTSLIGPYLTPDTSCSSHSYPAGAEYRFEACVDNQPIHWPRCGTLAVAINPANAPAGWSDDVDNALTQLSLASGLRFQRTTTGADITIGWDRSMVLRGFGHKDKAGVTSLEMQSTLTGTEFSSAAIEISSDLSSGVGSEGEVPVLLHELGHAVGLGHFNGPVVMNPIDTGLATYQSGDLAGLSTLYHGQSCR
jgi:Matrixin